MTVKQILIDLGYVQAGVELDKGIMMQMQDYLSFKRMRKTSYVDKDFKFIGDLYKYYFIVEHAHGLIQNKSFNQDDSDDYTSKFWKIYTPKELKAENNI